MTLRPSAQSVSRYRFAAAYAAVRPIRRTRAASSIVKKLGRAITPPTPETSSRAATGRRGRHTTHPTPRNQLPCRESVLQQIRSEEHTSELQSLMRISYAVFCLKKKRITQQITNDN